nr:hypothetical protein Iba_chr09eCG10020 [Ipomoea batatas]GMD39001.1 hypothetical protein Iba_chr09fCG9420 [Ipomoea batatas]GMD39002.1 hypothetical protein Iba_chr09fCG9430 [Ipomoea batatas]
MNGDLDPVVWFIISTAGKDPSKSTPLALFGVGSNHDATFASSEFWLSDSLLKYWSKQDLEGKSGSFRLGEARVINGVVVAPPTFWAL